MLGPPLGTGLRSAPPEQKLRIGCSGWSYQDWAGPFYPKSAQPKDFLRLYSSVFNTVEIDSSFYRIPNRFMISLWKKNTPEGFLFTAKFPKEITHEAKLKGVSDTLSYFYGTLEGFEDKLGALIIQLPPSFKYDGGMPVLEGFLSEVSPNFRHAIEFRHKSWFREDVYQLLQKHNVANCWSINQYLETPTERTANFIYARMVGDRAITKFTGKQRDTTEEMKKMHTAIEANLDSVDEAFVFFNNHFAGFGPESVNEFRRLAGLMEMDWSGLSGQASRQRSLEEF